MENRNNTNNEQQEKIIALDELKEEQPTTSTTLIASESNIMNADEDPLINASLAALDAALDDLDNNDNVDDNDDNGETLKNLNSINGTDRDDDKSTASPSSVSNNLLPDVLKIDEIVELVRAEEIANSVSMEAIEEFDSEFEDEPPILPFFSAALKAAFVDELKDDISSVCMLSNSFRSDAYYELDDDKPSTSAAALRSNLSNTFAAEKSTSNAAAAAFGAVLLSELDDDKPCSSTSAAHKANLLKMADEQQQLLTNFAALELAAKRRDKSNLLENSENTDKEGDIMSKEYNFKEQSEQSLEIINRWSAMEQMEFIRRLFGMLTSTEVSDLMKKMKLCDKENLK